MNGPKFEEPSNAGDSLLVHFVAEGGADKKTYNFGSFPVSAEFQAYFADGFRRETGPAGRRRTVPSADSEWVALKRFAKFLASLEEMPQTVSELSGHHVDAAKIRFGNNWKNVRSALRTVFLHDGDVPVAFRRKLLEPTGSLRRSKPVHGYSPEHHRIVLRAAKETVRAAYERILSSRQRVESYRQGAVVADEGQRLATSYQSDVLENGYKAAFSQHRGLLTRAGLSGSKLAKEMHLSVEEAGAVAVLLVALTGENLGQILSLAVHHHRADSQDGKETAVVLSRTSKPRRGANDSEKTVPLTGKTSWDPAPDDEAEVEGVDLSSPFGVHTAATYMCANARLNAGSDRLIVGFGLVRGSNYKPVTRSHVGDWYDSVHLTDGQAETVRGDVRRLRRTFVEAKQKPVAQNVRTFLNTYLLRDRGNIAEYQRVVARVLDKEVARARTAVARIITSTTVELANTDPEAAARLVGTDTETLKRSLAGELDTVMASCLDNENSPFTAAGSPCGASFMLCLGCPNARAEPRHLPVQLLVFEELQSKRLAMEAAEWAVKFAVHHARLVNLFGQFPAATVDAARGTETAEDVELVQRFLGRELDVK